MFGNIRPLSKLGLNEIYQYQQPFGAKLAFFALHLYLTTSTMIVLYALVSLFISWIWIDYFRLIDIFEKEHWKQLLPMFLIGSLSVGITWLVNDLYFIKYHLTANGDFLHDLIYYMQAGFLEEVSKLIPFLLFALIFHKKINEPIDYIIYLSISALAFAAIENTMYFHNHGAQIIDGRAILSTVGHVFYSSMVAYGIIQYRRSSRAWHIWKPIAALLIAALMHGTFNLIISLKAIYVWNWIFLGVFFLVNISVFATILNNAMNNSSHFSYKKVIDSDKVSLRLLLSYGIVFLAQFLILIFDEGITHALINLLISIKLIGLIVFVTALRLSRFTLIKDFWKPINPEMPFSFISDTGAFKLTVKGQFHNEVMLNKYFEDYCVLHPVSVNQSTIGYPRISFIEQKFYPDFTNPHYLIRVYEDDAASQHKTYIVSLKIKGTNSVHDKYPIVSIMQTSNHLDLTSYEFIEWGYITPVL